MRQANMQVWPAPVLGLQRAGTYIGAPGNAAEVLDNFLPTATGARLRGGCTLFATIGASVQQLMLYKSGAVEQLFAATDDSIFDISSPADPDVAPVADLEGLASGDWAFTQFGNSAGQFCIIVNGSDAMHYYDGANWWPISAAINIVNFDALTTHFTVGETVTGGTSGASAVIRAVRLDTATTGALLVGAITAGPFQNNEALTSAGGAATAGVIGSAGTLFGVSGLTGSALMTGLSVGSSLLSGFQGMAEGKSQAKQMYAQTSANIAEQARQSTQSAYQEKKAAEGTRRQQKIAYLASGVSLSGSPLAVMEETRQRGLSNAAEVIASNDAYTKATGAEGTATSKQLISSGRSQFIKGVTGALTTYANK